MRGPFLRCLVCNSDDIGIRSIFLRETQQELKLAECASCGHASRLEDRDQEMNLTIQERFFDGDAILPDKKYIRWPRRLALVAAEVKRLVGDHGKALDVGCNTGLWLAALGDRWERLGVELSPVAAALARGFINAEIHTGPIESYRILPESLDLLTAFAVIEHLSEPRMLTNWAHVHLKPGGVFVLMTGDRESDTAKKMGAEWPLFSPEGHLHFFSARSLCRLVEESGFHVLRKEWRFMYLPSGHASLLFRVFTKVKEILRLVTDPRHDHFYLYCRK